MSLATEEVSKLYNALLKSFEESSIIDDEITLKLEEKLAEFKNEDLLKKWTEIIAEIRHDEKEESLNRMSNKLVQSTSEKRRRTIKVKLTNFGKIISKFLPGFECVYQTEVVKETNIYGGECDEGEGAIEY